MSLPVATLSCEQCRLRKVKCNKGVPCSSCVAADIQCTAVLRHRRPRGRTAKQQSCNTVDARAGRASKQSLAQRIAQLERTVEQLRDLGNSSTSSVLDSDQASPETSGSTDSYLAASFWIELSDTFCEIKDVLSSDVDIAANAAHSNAKLDSGLTQRTDDVNAHCLLFGPVSSTSVYTDKLEGLQDWLLKVYEDRVDAIFKPICLRPASHLLDRQNDLSLSVASQIEVRALKAAMCFTAICSLSNDELDDRKVLAYQFRAAAEMALYQADLLTTTSLVVLQAFVIYLAGLRALQANAQQWTLLALAIRLANAQGIPASLGQSPLSLDTESKRWLWVAIGILDLQSSMDRATQPLLESSDLQDLQSEFYDFAMYPTMSGTSNLSRSDMCFVLVTHRAGICQRKLAEIGARASYITDASQRSTMLQAQTSTLAAFEADVQRMTKEFGIVPSPLQSFTLAVADESLLSMQLLLRRPLHRPNYSIVPQVSTPDDNKEFNTLDTALTILERSQNKRTLREYAQWSWFSWPKWYALAIVLAELCNNRVKHDERVWNIAQASFNDYAEIVADSKTGLLWRPIAKLMARARAVRCETRSMPDGMLVSSNKRKDGMSEVDASCVLSVHDIGANLDANQDMVVDTGYGDTFWFEGISLDENEMLLQDPWDILLDGLYESGSANMFDG